MKYGYQGLDPGSKVLYLLNGIRCDKLSTEVATVRSHPDKYEKDFNTIVNFLSQYIDKKAPTPSVKVDSVHRTDLPSSRRPALPMAPFRERLS